MVRHGRFADVVRLFECACLADFVLWNTLLAGFARHSCAQMWSLWLRMVREGAGADGFSSTTMLSGLTADADMAGGLQVHGQFVCVGNSLVEMYMKNGPCSPAPERSPRCLREMSCRGQRWPPVGYTAASLLIKAVGVLGPMMLDGTVPNN
ncbi:hypothetical protein ACQ4PT_013903 [Festuca glaucescens]